jgi:hypothetical protein
MLLPKVYTNIHERYVKTFIDNVLMNIRVDNEIESDYMDID